MNRVRLIAVASAAAVLLTGCATQNNTGAAGPNPSGSGPAAGATTSAGAQTPAGTGNSTPSVPVPATRKLPPTTPSDQLPAGVVVGTVSTASGGPCYLIETDDGNPYALYGSGGTLARGQRVRVQTKPLSQSVSCGPGLQLAIVKLEVSG